MADDIKIVGLSSKKSSGTNWKVISAIIGIVVLSIGVIAGIFLVRQQQDIREKASGNCTDPKSIVKCPASDGNLYSCNPPDSNNNAQISSCNVAGRIELCGVDGSVKEYCCPVAGGAWTLDTSECTCDAKAPTSLSFENISPTSTKLKWTVGAGGKYRLWVSTNPAVDCSVDPASCIANDLSITPTTVSEYLLTNLTSNTKYYWRIMAWTKSGCDAGNAIMNFTTASDSMATSTSTPISTATATSISVTKTATPTATSTTKATSTSTSSSKTSTPTSKASSTSTAKATGSATAFPVPETGAEWPTVIGAGFGIVMLLVSLALAL